MLVNINIRGGEAKSEMGQIWGSDSERAHPKTPKPLNNTLRLHGEYIYPQAHHSEYKTLAIYTR